MLENQIIQGDCLEVMQLMPSVSIDLIVTSPPYADSRKKTYGGIPPLKEQGWLWTEEFIWHKKNCFPGKWTNRFRDAWEHCYQFNKEKKFAMYQEAVMVPMGNWKEKRLKKLSETDKIRDDSKVGSGFGKNVSNWLNRDMAYPTNVINAVTDGDTQEFDPAEFCDPTNVLNLSTECGNKNHSAAFSRALPEWFIKLFTAENDYVLDPFNGSGTTTTVAHELKRKYTGIEFKEEYVNQAKEKINNISKISA